MLSYTVWEKYLLRDNILSGAATKEAEKVWQDKRSVENLVPQHIRNYYETRLPSRKSQGVFMDTFAETQDLAKKAGWELNLKIYATLLWFLGKKRNRSKRNMDIWSPS